MINYAIVGVGGFAATWIRCLEKLQGQGLLRLSAVTELQRTRYASELQRLADAGVRVHATFEEMLAGSNPASDIIGLPVGIPVHAELALQALRAGFNVHVEKPITPVIQQVYDIQRTCAETGRWCAVGYQFIYSPTIQWLRAKLRQGALGRITEARGVTGWPRTASYYARNNWAGRIRCDGRWVLDGPATNATAHYLTNLLYLCAAQQQGDAPGAIERVRAELYRAKPIESYDTSCIEIDMSGGIRILHAVTHATTQPLEPAMDILCEKGTVHWEARSDAAVVRYADGRVETFANPEPENVHDLPFRQVAQAAANQAPGPLCGAAEALPQVLAINLAFESSHGVHTIPSEHIRIHAETPKDELVTIAGIHPLLLEAQSQGHTLSQSSAPWAEPGVSVSAASYTSFPSESLAPVLSP